MESKLVKGLYLAGEIIDVDAYTGGFNLQIAYSTGYTAGMNWNKNNELINCFNFSKFNFFQPDLCIGKEWD